MAVVIETRTVERDMLAALVREESDSDDEVFCDITHECFTDNDIYAARRFVIDHINSLDKQDKSLVCNIAWQANAEDAIEECPAGCVVDLNKCPKHAVLQMKRTIQRLLA
jgi:hypothetical protein